MKLTLKRIPLYGCLLLFLASCRAQEPTQIISTGAYVNFNLGASPVPDPGTQEVTLFGCNTIVRKEKLVWDEKNQILEDVPYGFQEAEDGRIYYVSKYYMASPPVIQQTETKAQKKDSTVHIGLVLPDRFTFFGEKPVQITHLDYTILEPVYLNFVNVDYHYDDGINPTCGELGVNLVPLNIQCDDFRWLNKNATAGIRDAQGASGIARIYNKPQQHQVFLPSYRKEGDFLDCGLTILDDILLDHEVFFATEQGLVKSIDFTEFYEDSPVLNKDIKLACRVREIPPAGCLEPE